MGHQRGLHGWRREVGGGRPDLLVLFTYSLASVTSAAVLHPGEVVYFQQLIPVSYLPTLTLGPRLEAAVLHPPQRHRPKVGTAPSLGLWVQLFGGPSLISTLPSFPRAVGCSSSSVTSQDRLCVFQFSYTNLTHSLH